ncbi:septal ring lytic transglycosylase RlpA family protein [Flavobacterium sp.]|jgi:rare lipoprotein A|uniref:septal ring lytic transglycosylase RlpA family protein n=1 Tax=Flavobacterium sp. TaxID=239 RepID=UPI0022C5D3CB|nr:septal ring lytic transglycosylase RlpA family protein [Flavobacterium sp.]MCZ8229901.1 septal ring lytic transglycosylase RlpA family protein [Flavobacterium sp.]
MKKLLAMLFLLTVIGLIYSQEPSAVKEKGTISKDTIKKDKTNLLPSTTIKDTVFEPNVKYVLYKKNGHASYYADKFHGRKTASGQRFDMHKMTAAHKKLPFGSKIRVTNEANGKSVIVEVNDRGPFVRSREIDLSKKAFMAIASSKGSGSMKVTIETIVKR